MDDPLSLVRRASKNAWTRSCHFSRAGSALSRWGRERISARISSSDQGLGRDGIKLSQAPRFRFARRKAAKKAMFAGAESIGSAARLALPPFN